MRLDDQTISEKIDEGFEEGKKQIFDLVEPSILMILLTETVKSEMLAAWVALGGRYDQAAEGFSTTPEEELEDYVDDRLIKRSLKG